MLNPGQALASPSAPSPQGARGRYVPRVFAWPFRRPSNRSAPAVSAHPPLPPTVFDSGHNRIPICPSPKSYTTKSHTRFHPHRLSRNRRRARKSLQATFPQVFCIRSAIPLTTACGSIAPPGQLQGVAGMAERGGARTRGVAGTWPPREGARSGSIAPSGFVLWPSFAARLREWIAAEAGAGRVLPWGSVAFGTRIAFYFTADHEPVAWVTAVAATGFCVAAFLLRRKKLFPVAVMIAAISAGFAAATWKTQRIAHGVLARPMYGVSLSGFVETRDIRERTDRFVLRVTQMESPRSEVKLERVRLSVRKGTAPAVGSFVELKARLQPPLAPMRPGSYDFGRDMFFQGIGASGFVTGAIKTVEQPPLAGGLSLRYAALMQDLRDA